MRVLFAFFIIVASNISHSATINKKHIFPEETQLVLNTFRGKTISAIYNFCQEKPFGVTCGQLVQFVETRSFIYNFASLERQVAATVYYIEKSNGRFQNVLDEIPDGIVGIDKAFSYNSDLEVFFDRDGLPHVKNVRVVKHGTTVYSISDLTITHNGLRYDSMIHLVPVGRILPSIVMIELVCPFLIPQKNCL